MSLTVYPYLRNPIDGKLTELEETISPEHTDLFGLESWRSRVWGAAALKEMSCEILPSLSKMDIHAEGEELHQLEQELIKMLDQVHSLSSILKVDKNSLTSRIKNALAAINVAQKHQYGGVCIG